MKMVADWQAADPWIRYAASTQLLDETREKHAALYAQSLTDQRLRVWLADVAAFHDTVVSRHNSMNLPMHKLLFLLDLGFGSDVPQIGSAVEAILRRRDGEGVFQSAINVSKNYGGSGETGFGWALCDAPLLATALLMAGVPYAQVQPCMDTLQPFGRRDGFPCAVSAELGSFHGPGRRQDDCPYATLAMLRLLSQVPALAEGDTARDCVDGLLALWEHSRERHPYLFYMGTDFRKLKAPLVWYDIVAVLDVLSRFAFAQQDPRFQDMAALLASKQLEDGRFVPESVYMACKGWDCGQKKEPSPTLTFYCLRIAKRIGELHP